MPLMDRFKLSTRLIINFIFVGLIPFVTIAGFAVYMSNSAMSEQITGLMSSSREMKSKALQNFLGRKPATWPPWWRRSGCCARRPSASCRWLRN